MWFPWKGGAGHVRKYRRKIAAMGHYACVVGCPSGGDSCALNFAGHPQVNREDMKPSSGKQAELWRSSVF